jgi:hypothetical protein
VCVGELRAHDWLELARPRSEATPASEPAHAEKACQNGRMRRAHGLSGFQLVGAGAVLVGLLTVVLWVSGVIHDAATVTAYSTMLLAIGTASLAFGAIGTYVEQRRANVESAAQVERQNRQLEAAKENEIAQVRVIRSTGPGQYAAINIANRSARAIRFVYVWVTVQGITGHYLTVVKPPNDATGFAVRQMQHTRRVIGDDIIEWCYRSMSPGAVEEFLQFRTTNPDAMPSGIPDDWITAYATFSDVDGVWWKCSEDGIVEKLPAEPAVVSEPPRPIMGDGIPGLPQFRVHRKPPVQQQHRCAEALRVAGRLGGCVERSPTAQRLLSRRPHWCSPTRS